jgi:phosphate starvation-inducible PhoH-like protein
MQMSPSDYLNLTTHEVHYPLTDIIKRYEFRVKKIAERLKEEGYIEVAALAYMRGWNVDNTILVFEEAQNATPAQIKLLLTRIGFNSKFFLSGDLEQSDKFKDKTKTGLYDAKKRLDGVKGIGVFEFGMEDIVRNPIISEILKRYE